MQQLFPGIAPPNFHDAESLFKLLICMQHFHRALQENRLKAGAGFANVGLVTSMQPASSAACQAGLGFSTPSMPARPVERSSPVRAARGRQLGLPSCSQCGRCRASPARQRSLTNVPGARFFRAPAWPIRI